jgi:2-keto-4-pentenoate hydratase/2-oxohepta-3-ene-1,7-dioic acid hydratase in catechol pathway
MHHYSKENSMRYIRYSYHGKIGYGILEGQLVRPIEGSPFDTYTTTEKSIAIEKVRLLSPCLPSKAICIGLNYKDHAKEVDIPIPASPVVFLKPSSSVIGPEDTIIYPPQSKRLDYEAELAIVIGKTTSRIDKSHAHENILGYTCANDITARDLQAKDGQWTIAKGFDTFLPLGPVISDEIDPTNVAIESRLNGKVCQSSNTSHLIFDIPYLVSYLSHIMTLYPGDVILTGTPSGIGAMQVGDRIEVEIEGIGILGNTVVKQD